MSETPISPRPALPISDDRVLSVVDAAIWLGCSVATIKRCHKRGELKILKLSPRRIGVRLSELKTFVDSRAA